MKRKKYMTVTEAVQYLLQNTVKGVTYNSETSEMTITYNKEDGIATETFTVGGGDTSELEQAIENLEQNLGTVEQNLGNVEDDVADLKSNKQDKLKAGSGITINPETNEISSDGATYTAGTNINIDENNKISCTVNTSNFVKADETFVNYNSKIVREDNNATIKELTILKNSGNGKQSITGLITRCQNVNGSEPSSDNTRFRGIVGLIANTSWSDYISASEYLYDDNDNTYLALVNGKIVESINNKYKKVYNTSKNSYSETFKGTDSSNISYTFTKEQFKFIAENTVVLSADVTVEEGFYEVSKVVIKDNSNNIMNESVEYKNLIVGLPADMPTYQSATINNPVQPMKIVTTITNTQTDVYQYDTSSTPPTLVEHKVYELTERE